MRFFRWLTTILAVLAPITTVAQARQFGAVRQHGVDAHARHLAADVHDSWTRQCMDMCERMGKAQCINASPAPKPQTTKKTPGEWKRGKMTYYWGSEPDLGYGTGTVGACDNALRPFKSVAVPEKLWPKLRGKTVHIKGVCTSCVVDDMCRGPECKDLDLYVGNTNDKQHDGIKSVQYKVGKQVKNHPCLK